jgi:hypothetical protein
MQRAVREHSLLSRAQEGLESRIHRKVSVRFGGGVTETWPGNRKRRWVPTLRASVKASCGVFLRELRVERARMVNELTGDGNVIREQSMFATHQTWKSADRSWCKTKEWHGQSYTA